MAYGLNENCWQFYLTIFMFVWSATSVIKALHRIGAATLTKWVNERSDIVDFNLKKFSWTAKIRQVLAHKQSWKIDFWGTSHLSLPFKSIELFQTRYYVGSIFGSVSLAKSSSFYEHFKVVTNIDGRKEWTFVSRIWLGVGVWWSWWNDQLLFSTWMPDWFFCGCNIVVEASNLDLLSSSQLISMKMTFFNRDLWERTVQTFQRTNKSTISSKFVHSYAFTVSVHH